MWRRSPVETSVCPNDTRICRLLKICGGRCEEPKCAQKWWTRECQPSGRSRVYQPSGSMPGMPPARVWGSQSKFLEIRPPILDGRAEFFLLPSRLRLGVLRDIQSGDVYYRCALHQSPSALGQPSCATTLRFWGLLRASHCLVCFSGMMGCGETCGKSNDRATRLASYDAARIPKATLL